MADVRRGLTVVLVLACERLVELAWGWRRVLMAGRVWRLRDGSGGCYLMAAGWAIRWRGVQQ
jgi:hypothetical protein